METLTFYHMKALFELAGIMVTQRNSELYILSRGSLSIYFNLTPHKLTIENCGLGKMPFAKRAKDYKYPATAKALLLVLSTWGLVPVTSIKGLLRQYKIQSNYIQLPTAVQVLHYSKSLKTILYANQN